MNEKKGPLDDGFVVLVIILLFLGLTFATCLGDMPIAYGQCTSEPGYSWHVCADNCQDPVEGRDSTGRISVSWTDDPGYTPRFTSPSWYIRWQEDGQFAPALLDLLELWAEYCDSCYADSFLVRTGTTGYPVPSPVITIDDQGRKVIDYRNGIVYPVYVESEEWEHREATGRGFLEFLVRKDKRNGGSDNE